jgi:hypothetical protein
MSDDKKPPPISPPAAEEPPPFQPDPDLITSLERGARRDKEAKAPPAREER